MSIIFKEHGKDNYASIVEMTGQGYTYNKERFKKMVRDYEEFKKQEICLVRGIKRMTAN